jgi:hypothetical protein
MNPVVSPPFPASRGTGAAAALICALLSVILIRSGILAIFFLAPLGYVFLVCSRENSRRALALACGGNILIALGLGFFPGANRAGLLLGALYYTVLILLFFWIMRPPERGPAALRVRTAYRLLASAAVGGLIFLFIEYTILNISGAPSPLGSQAELLSSLFVASSGADAARRSYAEQYLTPDRIRELLRLGAVRGGALASTLALLFIGRQLSFSLAWMIRRIRPLGPGAGNLQGFFAPRHTIWVMSFSLAAVLGARIGGLSIAENLAWNVLVMCAILFLAQGGGIVLYTLGRRAMPPMLRLVLNIAVIMLIFSPGINAVALGVLILLGIAENWAPFRASKPDGSSSTPGM